MSDYTAWADWFILSAGFSVDDYTDDERSRFGYLLASHPLTNPPKPKLKRVVFRCWHCGAITVRTYRTKPPRYCSQACRKAASRAGTTYYRRFSG